MKGLLGEIVLIASHRRSVDSQWASRSQPAAGAVPIPVLTRHVYQRLDSCSDKAEVGGSIPLMPTYGPMVQPHRRSWVAK